MNAKRLSQGRGRAALSARRSAVLNPSELATARGARPAAWGILSDRQRLVVRRRYGLDGAPPSTWSDLGQTLGGVSHARAIQITRRALVKLAHAPTVEEVVES